MADILAWILVVALALVAIKTFLFMKGEKKVFGQNKNLIGVIAIVLAVTAYAAYIGSVPFVSDLGKTVGLFAVTPAIGDNVVNTLVKEGLCAVEDTTVTLSAISKYTSIAVGGAHRYRINGAPALTVSDSGTFTASPGDSIEILWTNASLTNGYYGSKSNVKVPCAGTATFNEALGQNGSITFEVFNEEGNLIDSSGENETMAAGDTVTLTARIKGQYQRSQPYEGLIVAEYNSTDTDDVIVDFGGVETSVPAIHSMAVGRKAKAYTVPPLDSNKVLEGTVYIDADDTINPATTGDPTLTYYPANYFTNEDTGGSFDGPAVEDEDDVATGLTIVAYTVSWD